MNKRCHRNKDIELRDRVEITNKSDQHRPVERLIR